MRAMRALRALGEEEDEDVTSEEAEEEESGDEREPGEGEGSEDESDGEEDEDDVEDTDWERFFDIATSRAGRPIYVSKLLNKRFTEASAARDFTTGKLHRRAASDARKRLLTFNEREVLAAKAAQRAEKRKTKALVKAKEKAQVKRKAIEYAPLLQRGFLGARRDDARARVRAHARPAPLSNRVRAVAVSRRTRSSAGKPSSPPRRRAVWNEKRTVAPAATLRPRRRLRRRKSRAKPPTHARRRAQTSRPRPRSRSTCASCPTRSRPSSTWASCPRRMPKARALKRLIDFKSDRRL